MRNLGIFVNNCIYRDNALKKLHDLKQLIIFSCINLSSGENISYRNRIAISINFHYYAKLFQPCR